ncbi:MAG: aldehyde dehydrogenase family protein [Oligoflexales bacterium]|nr:aldehyde dehydrogenase family protein [Oligoflexales bacterium]
MSGLSKDKSVAIAKTIKLFINGEFPRTESGRSFPVYFHSRPSEVYAHLCLASRKDLRNAVSAAKKVQQSWSERSAYNRGQILYRIAEMIEARRSEFVEILNATQGMDAKKSEAELTGAIEAFVYFAGFTDKYEALIGSVNPVQGALTNSTSVDAMGVVMLVAGKGLAATCADIAVSLCTGNSLVLLLDKKDAPLLASLAECIATSDMPAGVVNILSGNLAELAKVLAEHMEINTLSYQSELDKNFYELKANASDNLKRIIAPTKDKLSLNFLGQFVEFKTLWQTRGF